MKTKLSFTLAEVLITLVVIGIIAAITVPVIMANHKKTETAARLKKFYSTMNNAIKLAEVEEGIPLKEWEGSGDLTFDQEDVQTRYLVKHINYVDKKYEMNDFAGGEVPTFYLSDGTKFQFFYYAYYEGKIYFDTNGDKGPNKSGRDIFVFNIPPVSTNIIGVPNWQEDNPFVPCSASICNDYNSREEVIEACKQYKEEECTYLIQLDGWEIKADYPLKL